MMRVATIGWAGAQFDDVSLAKLEPHIARLAGEGAQIIVAPEAAFRVSDRAVWRAQIGALAARYQVWLTLGYFDNERNFTASIGSRPTATYGRVTSRRIWYRFTRLTRAVAARAPKSRLTAPKLAT